MYALTLRFFNLRKHVEIKNIRILPCLDGEDAGIDEDGNKEFLAGPIVARLGLGTVKSDGSPYVNPVWQYSKGRELYFIPRARSAFVRNIKLNPRICVLCALDSGHHTRVIFEAKAEMLDGPTLSGETRSRLPR